ncbi:DUF4249 domain-containing protein [Pollutibacter soli]|uniref:DUF4249 domain-containing protein n=1 Tax=Pollutibacter soli TaxID=3034157 RepID=UPI00301340BD
MKRLKFNPRNTFFLPLSRIPYTVLCILFFVSCEKDITIDLNDPEPKIVVEASIENNQPPFVVLSNSLNYFSKINPEILAASFVHNAEIFISDGTRTHKLVEDSIVDVQGYTLYFYTNNRNDPSTAIFGQLGVSYSLEINTGGEVFKANTTIPDTTKIIDSLWWEPIPVIDPEDSNKTKLMIKATDRPGYGDYVRYYTKVNSQPFFPGLNSVYDDQVIDGTTYILPVDRGINKNVELEEDDVFFTRGDTVTMKLSAIDKAVYDFWRTSEFSYQSIGNPFSNPVKILSNISNNALGYFGGYGSQFRTIVISK